MFSSSIHWILENNFQVPWCINILDDFLFLGEPNTVQCYNALLSFHDLANSVGIPIKKEKTVYPTKTITFIGLELDSLSLEVRLPQDKLDKLRSLLTAKYKKI